MKGGSITGDLLSNLVGLAGSGTFSASGVAFSDPNSNCIEIDNAGVSVLSSFNTYTTGNSAFRFTQFAGATVTSTYDYFACSGPYIATTTGPVGNIYTSFATAASGTSSSIDPILIQVPLTPISTFSGLPWQPITANQTLISNNGYIVASGALSLALPTISSVGDVISVLLDQGTSWTITQGAGQQIIYGSSPNSLGASGYIASSSLGDSVSLVCTVASTRWVCYASQGNILIN
jgi:hypothetical protein